MVAESVARMREKSDGSAFSVWMAWRRAALVHGSRGFLDCVVESRTVFSRYTSMQRETLPANAAKTMRTRPSSVRVELVTADGKLSGGVYWIAVVFY